MCANQREKVIHGYCSTRVVMIMCVCVCVRGTTRLMCNQSHQQRRPSPPTALHFTAGPNYSLTTLPSRFPYPFHLHHTPPSPLINHPLDYHHRLHSSTQLYTPPPPPHSTVLNYSIRGSRQSYTSVVAFRDSKLHSFICWCTFFQAGLHIY